MHIYIERLYVMTNKGASVSFEATKWVLESAPNLPPHLAMTLVALAWHADKEGRTAYPSQSTLAGYTRKSERAIRNDLSQLLDLGLIRRGDPRTVEHLPADARPAVYDLPVDASAERGRKPTSARNSTSARKRGTGGKPTTKGTGSPLPPATGSPLPPKVVPTELQVEPPLEPPLPTPAASEVEVLDAEIVDEPRNLPSVVSIPNAGQLTRMWIDYCATNNVQLTGQVIKRYGAAIKRALDEKFTPDLIKRALADMLADRVASRPALLDNYLIRAQQGPELPPRRASRTEASMTPSGGNVAALIRDALTRPA